MMARGNWGLDLLILSGLLVVFFGFQLGERALWSPAEGRYSEVAREMVVSGDYVTPRLDGVKFFDKPPLFYWLQSLSIGAFGLNETALRLWPALFALVSCLGVYIGARKLFGRRSGWIAAVVLATSGLHYAMSRMANLDMILSALITCALLAFLLGAREAPGPRRRLAMWSFYIFSALAVLEKGLIGIVISALVIGTWIALLNDWKIISTIYLPTGCVLFLAIAAPWHLVVGWINPEFFGFYFVREHFQRFLYKDGTFERPWSFVPVLLIGFFPWTLFLYQALRYNLSKAWRPRHGHREALFLALWAGWVFLFFSLSSSKVIPYILPMFPPLAILLGRYFARSWTKPKIAGLRAGCWLLLVSIVLLLALGLKGPQHYLERYSNWPNLEVPSDETTLPSTALAIYPDLSRMGPYWIAQWLILFCGGLATLYLDGQRRFRAAFAVLGATEALFLVVLNSSLPLMDQCCLVKDLALAIKPRLRPEDEVASYRSYYQDLPLYLQRHVVQVGWVEPFEIWEENFNKQAEGEAVFWRKWDDANTIYALSDRAIYEKLRAGSEHKIFLVTANNYTVVFSNKSDHGAIPRQISAR
ncbi:MAG TPA: phospholipid carrier-dependent glycosyltransferase [Candidatus Saccharimonadales bacterium]|nr:phospholipid carrier-dependent glycosyltransferase [Candidatus Saccharimonadales bacterium]